MSGTGPRPTEAACQATIIEAARLHGWLVHAERPARTATGWRTAIQGDPGFPDLVLARDGVVLVVELKRRPNKPTDAQWGWLTAFQRAGIAAHLVYVPEDMDAFIDELARRAA